MGGDIHSPKQGATLSRPGHHPDMTGKLPIRQHWGGDVPVHRINNNDRDVRSRSGDRERGEDAMDWEFDPTPLQVLPPQLESKVVTGWGRSPGGDYPPTRNIRSDRYFDGIGGKPTTPGRARTDLGVAESKWAPKKDNHLDMKLRKAVTAPPDVEMAGV